MDTLPQVAPPLLHFYYFSRALFTLLHLKQEMRRVPLLVIIEAAGATGPDIVREEPRLTERSSQEKGLSCRKLCSTDASSSLAQP